MKLVLDSVAEDANIASTVLFSALFCGRSVSACTFVRPAFTRSASALAKVSSALSAAILSAATLCAAAWSAAACPLLPGPPLPGPPLPSPLLPCPPPPCLLPPCPPRPRRTPTIAIRCWRSPDCPALSPAPGTPRGPSPRGAGRTYSSLDLRQRLEPWVRYHRSTQLTSLWVSLRHSEVATCTWALWTTLPPGVLPASPAVCADAPALQSRLAAPIIPDHRGHDRGAVRVTCADVDDI